MPYRICKSFEVESGHMLSKHPGLCRYPHGHSRRVEIVIAADALDSRDMVCDFKTIKLAVKDYLDRFDHAMAINSDDPIAAKLSEMKERLIILEKTDPTTEVLAAMVFRFLDAELRAGKTYTDHLGNAYAFPKNLRLERVRISETTSSWAEYSA